MESGLRRSKGPVVDEGAARLRTRGALRELLQGTVVGLLVTLVLFGLVEGATRLHHRYAREGFTAFEPVHLVDFSRLYRVNPDYRRPNVRVNAAGFRNEEEVTRNKPDNVVRIVIMGGSTVWGEDAGPPFRDVLIDNEDTIATQLQETLNARASARNLDLKVQVLNAGVVGYRLYQNLTYFNQRVARFNPDLVIAIDGHNDLDALGRGLDPYYHRRESEFERPANSPTLADLLQQTFKYVEQWSLFARKARGRMEGVFNAYGLRARGSSNAGNGALEEAAIMDWLDEYEATVRRFDASGRIAGVPVLFAVQPEIAGEHHKELTPKEQEIRKFYSWYEPLHTVARDRLIARMNELEDRHGVWFEDVTSVFEEVAPTAYLDYTHLSRAGARAMAERLADAVENIVFDDGSAQGSPSPMGSPISR